MSKSIKQQIYEGYCPRCNDSFFYRETKVRKSPTDSNMVQVQCPYCRMNISHDAVTVDALEVGGAHIFK